MRNIGLTICQIASVLVLLGDESLRADNRAEVVAEIHSKIAANYAIKRKSEIDRHLTHLKSNPSAGDAVVLMSSLNSLDLPAPEGISVYSALLNHQSAVVKQLALDALRRGYGKAASVAAAAAFQLFDDMSQHANVRAAAARTLGVLDCEVAKVVPSLVRELDDRSASVGLKRAVAEALGTLAKGSEPAVEALIRCLNHPSTEVQIAAFRALGNIKDFAVPTRSEMLQVERLNTGSLDAALGFFEAAKRHRDGSGVMAKALREDQRAYVKAVSIDTLLTIGADDPPAVEAVLQATGIDDRCISDLAVKSMLRLRARNPAIVDVMARGLGHARPRVRHHAAIGLQKFGPAASAAVPALMEALRQADCHTSHLQVGSYLQALRAIGPAAAASGTIVELLPERSPLYAGYGKMELDHLRGFMFITLAEIGVPKSALPHILATLASSDRDSYYVSAAAARAAAALGPDAPSAVPYLIQAAESPFADRPVTFDLYFGHVPLNGRFTSPRVEAIRALKSMGPAATAAIPLLTRFAAGQHDEQPDAPLPCSECEARVALQAIQK